MLQELQLKKDQILQFREIIKNDPLYFSEKVLSVPLWEKEKDILTAIKDNREVSVRSCNASGKTFTASRAVHWWLMSFEDSVVITTAPTFRQVKEILWREIRAAQSGKGLYNESSILDTQINISDKWFALGLSTDKPDQFQGFHSKNLMVIVDEASGVEEAIFEAIDGLKPDKVVLIGNPLRNQGRFADSFKDPYTKKISISAFDTPNVKENKTVIPGLITNQDIARIKSRYGEDSDVYRVRILGEFPKQDSDVFIAIDEVAKAMEREVRVMNQWEKKMGVDVARFGDDRTAIIIRQMEKLTRKEITSGQDLMHIAGMVIRIAKEEGVKPVNISIDSIGVGAGVVDRLREQGWAVNATNVAESAKDHEHYLNKRAELYGGVKDWLRTAQLPKDDDFYELANVKYKFTSKGQIQLESKDDMKKRGRS